MVVASGFDLRAMRAALLGVLRTISGVSLARDAADRAVTEEEATWVMPDDDTQATVKVSVFSVRGNGGAETRYGSLIGAPDDLDPNVCANRLITFNIKVECHRSEYLAFEYTEKIRSHLERPDTLETLALAGLTLNNMLGSFRANFTREGRLISMAGFDVLFNAVSNLGTDPAPRILTATATREV